MLQRHETALQLLFVDGVMTPSGRRLIVQCKRHAPFRRVWSGDMQRFLGAAKVRHGAIAVNRSLLQAWASGARLPSLE